MENSCWKILLVDDDEDDYILVHDWLETAKGRDFQMEWADNYEASLEVLGQKDFDAILIDYDLGGFNGLELTNEIVRRGFNGPTIILTGHGGYEVDLGAMKAGATEYLSKNETSPRLLERTIRYGIEHHRNMEALRRANDQLAHARDELEQRVQERTEELQRYTNQVEDLAQLSQDLAHVGRDIQAVLELVSRRVVEWIGDSSTITLIAPDGVWLENDYYYHPDAEALEWLKNNFAINKYRVGEGVAGQVALSGEPLFVPEADPKQMAQTATPAFREFLERFGLYSLMIVPMRAGDRVIGTLGISRTQPGRPYTLQDQAFLMEIAERTALAAENARLFALAQAELAERRRAEQALRESQALFERLFESAPDPTLLLHKNGRIQQVNRQTLEVFGYSFQEIVDQSFTLLLPARFHPLFLELLTRAESRLDGKPQSPGKDLAGLRKDRQEFPIELVLAPFQLASRSGYIFVIHDITTRKAMEAELAEVPRRLLEGVEAERLRLAKELHDGPIQEMYGVAFGLRSISAELGTENFHSIMRVEEMLKRIYETIQTMRDISRLLRPPTLSPFGLEKTIRSHLELFKEQNPGIDLVLDLQPDNQELPEAVRLVFFRIFQNAMSNIVRHANASQVKITFRLEDETATLDVVDDGQGFIFQERWVDFVRHGHLGLAGSNERAEAIGGKLDIITKPGEGTRVRVTAPIKLK